MNGLLRPTSAKALFFFHEHLQSFGDRTRAFIKVQDGCNNFCTFCIIPKTRGISRSIEPTQVIEQIKQFYKNGYNEVVLTGIDLGAYGKDLKPRQNLASLLEKVAAMRIDMRIRISSLDPEDLTQEVVSLVAQSPMFANHLHLPLQSGHSEILRRMRRSYSAEEYRAAIESVLQVIPDCAIGTDIITGFPGETATHFAATTTLANEIPFTYLHVFPYSPKSGTAAATMDDQIDVRIARQRCQELRMIGEEQKRTYMQNHIGKTVRVLTERESTNDSGKLIGYSESYVPCKILGSASRLNTFINGVGESVSDGYLEVRVG